MPCLTLSQRSSVLKSFPGTPFPPKIPSSALRPFVARSRSFMIVYHAVALNRLRNVVKINDATRRRKFRSTIVIHGLRYFSLVQTVFTVIKFFPHIANDKTVRRSPFLVCTHFLFIILSSCSSMMLRATLSLPSAPAGESRIPRKESHDTYNFFPRYTF